MQLGIWSATSLESSYAIQQIDDRWTWMEISLERRVWSFPWFYFFNTSDCFFLLSFFNGRSTFLMVQSLLSKTLLIEGAMLRSPIESTFAYVGAVETRIWFGTRHAVRIAVLWTIQYEFNEIHSTPTYLPSSSTVTVYFLLPFKPM